MFTNRLREKHIFHERFADTSGFWDIGLSRNTVANYSNGQPPNINPYIQGDEYKIPNHIRTS